jgi:Bacterial putative lipoprotein (DUF940).
MVNNYILKKEILFLLIALFLPVLVLADDGNKVVDKLVSMGFENVCVGENDKERVYVIENVAYRIEGVGIGKAIDLIQEEGLPNGKKCSLVVLNNNVPTLSLTYDGSKGGVVNRNDWNVSYNLNDSWEIVKKEKKKNSSLYKVDLVLYPEFNFMNVKLSVMYEVLLNIVPTIETSLWKGGKLSAQMIVPIINQYGYKYGHVRPGFVTLSHTVRLPKNIFLTGTIGSFNGRRWGADLKAVYHLKNERLWFDARVSYTGYGEWGEWNEDKLINGFKFVTDDRDVLVTGSVGFNYYVPKFQTQLSLHFERFLGKEYGARFDMIRNFKYCNIGFYLSKIQYAGNKGFNGGLSF